MSTGEINDYKSRRKHLIDMALYDVTLPLSPELAVYKGDPAIKIMKIACIDEGDVCNLSEICMSVHSGTHVDAPSHFIPHGKDAGNLDLDILMGLVQVVDARGFEMITGSVLRALKIPTKSERVLFLTDNTDRGILHAPHFMEDFTAIDETGAQWLVGAGVRLVGIDAFSVAPFLVPIPTHHILLGSEVIVIEGLDLKNIKPGQYHMIAAPLKIKDCDGAPIRVILKDIEK